VNNKLTVLDASALLAVLQDEPGANEVQKSLADDETFVSSVNYAEVISHLKRNHQDMDIFEEWFSYLEITLVPFDKELAGQTGLLKATANKLGLSLADCACLTLAKHLNAVALTADTAWNRLKDDFNVKQIR